MLSVVCCLLCLGRCCSSFVVCCVFCVLCDAFLLFVVCFSLFAVVFVVGCLLLLAVCSVLWVLCFVSFVFNLIQFNIVLWGPSGAKQLTTKRKRNKPTTCIALNSRAASSPISESPSVRHPCFARCVL